LGELCFPGTAEAALTELVDGCLVGTTVEVCFEADQPLLLGLPFEATCLPDGRVLALQPPVTMMRRPVGPAAAKHWVPLAGPLKILIAIAAPEKVLSSSAVLDQERELQNILDAVEPAQRHENCELEDEEGSPQRTTSAALLEPIRQAGRARACRVT
jgi:hypothetical protein